MQSQPECSQPAPRTPPCLAEEATAEHASALVWRRHDFSETSRLLTLITPEQGRIVALAKGAHRASSPFLGRIDWLNVVRPVFARRTEGRLRLLRDAELVHEHRALREPPRFLTASWVCELLDPALVDDRADPALFGFLLGALRVLERCPATALATALAGIELKALDLLGVRPDLTACSECGRGALGMRLATSGRGLVCPQHYDTPTTPVPEATLRWLRGLDSMPARAWTSLPPAEPRAFAVLELWLGALLDRPPSGRKPALRAALAATKRKASR